MGADVRGVVAAHWDGRAATFDDEPDHGLADPRTRQAWRRRLVGWLPPAPARVADLGCGTGSLTVLMASEGHRVVASDVSPAMVRRTRAKALAAGVDVDVSVADAACPGLPARSLDVVLVRHVAWTLADPQAAIAAWVSLLRPGGRLVMVEGRWGTAATDAVDEPVDHGDYDTVRTDLPWYGGVGATVLLEEIAQHVLSVEHHDLTGDDALWGGPVTDERYAVVAHLG